MSIGSATSTGQ